MTAPSQSGFALPIVLLVIGALAGAAVLAALAARGNARGTATGTGLAQADALADAGIALAILDLEQKRAAQTRQAPPAPPGRWRHACSMAPGALRLTAEDEGGKLDLNYADARLLTALFVGLGQERARAQALADAIIDDRDPDDDRQPFGAERTEYAEAGRPEGPRNARFTDTAQVGTVLGMTPDLVARISPYITVHSARDGIDPTVADAALVALLVRGDAGAPVAAGEAAETPTFASTDSALPPPFVQPSLRRYYTIVADAQLANTRIVREAIVEASAPAGARAASRQINSRYRIWSWRRRDHLPIDSDGGMPLALSPSSATPAPSALPPC